MFLDFCVKELNQTINNKIYKQTKKSIKIDAFYISITTK